MKSSRKKPLKKISANITVGLFIMVFFGNSIAGQLSGQVNSFLGTPITQVVGEGAGEYVCYYRPEFGSTTEPKAVGLAKAEEVEAEDTALLKNNDILPPASPEVSSFGATAAFPTYSGTDSGVMNTADAPSYVDALIENGPTVTSTALPD